jgi:hypothetical protein
VEREIQLGERLYVKDSTGKVQFLAIKSISTGKVRGVVQDQVQMVCFDGIKEPYSLEDLLSKQDVLSKEFPRELETAITSWDFKAQPVWK